MLWGFEVVVSPFPKYSELLVAKIYIRTQGLNVSFVQERARYPLSVITLSLGKTSAGA